MDVKIAHALKTDSLIDITTVGRKTRKPHKIEIAFHHLDGSLYISGLPGHRDWYANLVAHPQFTFHLKQSAQVDMPAQAIPITDETVRRQVLSKITAEWGRQDDLETFVTNSPLVQVQFESK